DQAIDASYGGRADEALQWFDEALKADPEGAEAHNGRGEILWDGGRIDEALYAFEQSIAVDSKFVTAHLNRSELLIEDLGEYVRAMALCDELLAGHQHLPRVERAVELELYYLKAKAFYYQGDLSGSLFLIRKALKVGGEVALYRVFEGQALFESAEFQEARQVLERALMLDPDSAHAGYYLGLTLEHLGEDVAAAQAFEEADALDPDHYPRPTSFGAACFRKALKDAIEDLPKSLARHLKELSLVTEPLPEASTMRQEDVSPQTLGLFDGAPRREVPEAPADSRNKIVLFKRNFEKIARNEEELSEQLTLVLKSELGHYLGLDDTTLEGLGLL
ncbi:MAG: tetratricopeptide repeat protein, partial [Deltaproteobacteria bacterium]|nr:tetratricopeptide repeat protein [Deltaproteobacteria bacterium]